MKNIRIWSISGFIFTLAAGTLLHFIYDWLGGTVASVLGAVNESLWEHLKLIFWPAVIFGIIEYIAYGKSMRAFIPAKVLASLAGMLAVIMLFYTYSGILGYNIMVIDILIFVIGAAFSYYISYRLMLKHTACFSTDTARIIFLIIALALIICFILFTFTPPHIPLFRDPKTGAYGIA